MNNKLNTGSMPDIPRLRRDAAGFETLDLSGRGLVSLATPAIRAGGTLSPLARMSLPDGSPDDEALTAALQNLAGPWIWSVPALFDPGRAIDLILGDGTSGFAGQYLFPDPEGYGPGFQVSRAGDRVRLTGPVSLAVLRAGFFSRLSLETVADPGPIHVELPADHLWVLVACIDATRAAALERRLQRQGGAPAGVSAAQIVRAWGDGIASPDPGWTVSLFRLLAPRRMPADLAERLPDLIAEMVRLNRIRQVDPDGAGEPLFTLPPLLSPLVWGLSGSLNFGLVSQWLDDSDSIEGTSLIGWRTPSGIWLVDLGEEEVGEALLLFVGPDQFTEIAAEVLGDESLATPWEQFMVKTDLDRDTLVSRIRGVPPWSSQETAPPQRRFCTQCGQDLSSNARFCRSCGANLQPEQR